MPLELKKKPSKLAKRILATHEAGHAVCAWHEPLMSDVKKVRVRFKKREGFTKYKTRYVFPCDREDYLADITCDLAGIAAEKIVFGRWANGAGQDLINARTQIEEMILDMGMSEAIGPLHLSTRPMSPAMTAQVEKEAQKILRACLKRAEASLLAHRAALDKVAGALIKRKILFTEDLVKLIGKRPKAVAAPPPKNRNARRK